MATTAYKRRNAPPAPASAETVASPDAKRKPIQTFREGDVSVSIWAREFTVQGQPRTFYSCTFERSYRDRDGAWRYTNSIDLDSLGRLVALAQRADEYLRGLAETPDTRGV